MSYTQWVAPDLSAGDLAGACLRFTQRVFQNKNAYYYRSAWVAWESAVHRSFERNLPSDVAVPVYFSHWGTYNDGLGQYGPDPSNPYWGNWGHVVTWVPGRGYLSSPANGWGSAWYSSIEAIEQTFNAKFVGWALDVGGLTVAWPNPAGGTTNSTPSTPTEDTVKTFAGRSERSKPQVIGDKEAYVTYLDDHDASAWGDRTLMRGPGIIAASNITVTLKGEPGTRVALRLIRETSAGKNVYEYKPARAVIDSYGLAVVELGLSAQLAKGQLVRLKAQAQAGRKVTVTRFTWDGSNQPGA